MEVSDFSMWPCHSPRMAHDSIDDEIETMSNRSHDENIHRGRVGSVMSSYSSVMSLEPRQVTADNESQTLQFLAFSTALRGHLEAHHSTPDLTPSFQSTAMYQDDEPTTSCMFTDRDDESLIRSQNTGQLQYVVRDDVRRDIREHVMTGVDRYDGSSIPSQQNTGQLQYVVRDDVTRDIREHVMPGADVGVRYTPAHENITLDSFITRGSTRYDRGHEENNDATEEGSIDNPDQVFYYTGFHNHSENDQYTNDHDGLIDEDMPFLDPSANDTYTPDGIALNLPLRNHQPLLSHPRQRQTLAVHEHGTVIFCTVGTLIKTHLITALVIFLVTSIPICSLMLFNHRGQLNGDKDTEKPSTLPTPSHQSGGAPRKTYIRSTRLHHFAGSSMTLDASIVLFKSTIANTSVPNRSAFLASRINEHDLSKYQQNVSVYRHSFSRTCYTGLHTSNYTEAMQLQQCNKYY